MPAGADLRAIARKLELLPAALGLGPRREGGSLLARLACRRLIAVALSEMDEHRMNQERLERDLLTLRLSLERRPGVDVEAHLDPGGELADLAPTTKAGKRHRLVTGLETAQVARHRRSNGGGKIGSGGGGHADASKRPEWELQGEPNPVPVWM